MEKKMKNKNVKIEIKEFYKLGGVTGDCKTRHFLLHNTIKEKCNAETCYRAGDRELGIMPRRVVFSRRKTLHQHALTSNFSVFFSVLKMLINQSYSH